MNNDELSFEITLGAKIKHSPAVAKAFMRLVDGLVDGKVNLPPPANISTPQLQLRLRQLKQQLGISGSFVDYIEQHNTEDFEAKLPLTTLKFSISAEFIDQIVTQLLSDDATPEDNINKILIALSLAKIHLYSDGSDPEWEARLKEINNEILMARSQLLAQLDLTK